MSKEAYQYLATGEQPLSALFPVKTPEQRPGLIKPSWWQEFEKAKSLHAAGYSLAHIQTLKACRETKDWMKNPEQNAHMINIFIITPVS